MMYREVSELAREKFFNIISSHLRGRFLELEVASLDLGDQIEEEWVGLLGLSYNAMLDRLYIHTSHLDYAIRSPHLICIGEEFGVIRSIAMKDDHNDLRVLNFREPILIASRLASVFKEKNSY